MSSSILYSVLFIQLSCVMAVMWFFRNHISFRLNVLISSAFVTVPIANFERLSDAGSLFLFDIVVSILFAVRLFSGDFSFGKTSAKFSVLILLIPLIYAPVSYLFLDDNLLYHTVVLLSMLARSLIIVQAMVLLESELSKNRFLFVIRLFVLHFLVLFVLGSLQYLAGFDFVIYERIHDTENIVEKFLSGDIKIFMRFGFLGLFRGAVSQMAIVAIFWSVLLALHPRSNPRESYSIDLLLLFTVICVAGSMSRIGAIAIVAVTLVASVFHSRLRTSILLYSLVAVLFLFSYDVVSMMGDTFAILLGRFDVEQFTGVSGSGVTRLESALALYRHMAVDWKPWVVGLGGFNPLATNQHYGVYGMHGDYLELLVRHGFFIGIIYIFLLVFGVKSLMKGFFSKVDGINAFSRAFLVLVIGVMVLAMTQGTLTFAGSAGYLACAQTWFAIFFIAQARKIQVSNGGGYVDEFRQL